MNYSKRKRILIQKLTITQAERCRTFEIRLPSEVSKVVSITVSAMTNAADG